MEPIALSVDDAAKTLSIGRTFLYGELKAGRLRAVKVGKKKTLITRESLNEWLQSLEAYPSDKKGASDEQ